MTVNQKVTGTAATMAGGIGVGLLGSLLLTLIGAGVIAWLLNMQVLPEEMIGYGAMATLLLSAAAGAWISFHKIKRRRMIVCLILGGAYYLTLLATTALLFGGQYSGMATTGLMIFAGCTSVGLLGLKAKGKQKFKLPQITTG